MRIFVIVDVTYDYFRFQENLNATTSLKEARKMAKAAAAERDCPVAETTEASDGWDKPEVRHIWIEKFTNKFTNKP